GLAVPGADFSDPGKFNAEAGFRFGGSFEHMITRSIAVGADGSYNRNNRGTEGADPVVATAKDQFTTIQLGVHARVFFPMANSPVSLWALLGVGGYSLKEKWSVTYNNGAPS